MHFYLRLFCALLLACSLQAREYISSFNADITVHKDSTIAVKETIKVKSEGITIRRGIVREFPTRYTAKNGTHYVVTFVPKSVLLDGRAVNYKLEHKNNGVYLYIGNPSKYLSSGNYTYTIIYTTSRQLGYFENHDELYWNVTGNGWRLPIDRVTATVRLPENIPADQIKVEGYTGYSGRSEQDYRASVSSEGVAIFSSTRPFSAYEGMTIVVSWPKGFVDVPGWWQKILWFFKDNTIFLLFILSMFLIMYLLYRDLERSRLLKGDKPTIPLFYPPNGITPGLMNYIMPDRSNSKAFTADVVNMAVHGWLTIDYSPGSFFAHGQYTLIKKDGSEIEEGSYYKALSDILFKDKNELKLDRNNTNRLLRADHYIDSENQKRSADLFQNRTTSICVVLIGVLNCIVAATVGLDWALITAICFAIFWAIAVRIESYTKKGFEVKREIDGFKMFLIATEQERMKLVGTPPTRTPELYEKYLPYAIALGVEEAWGAAFDAIFKRLEKEGNAYMPYWYRGNWRGFNPSHMGSNIARGMSTAISSSSVRPGSSSGSGGRGSSGGGGGGGGGGGW